MEATTPMPKRRAMRVGEMAQRQRMTRYEARMIAEELHKLMKAEQEAEPLDELLTSTEAAAYLNMSKSFVEHNKDRIPHVKVGRMVRYTKAGLSEFAKQNGRQSALL